MLSPFDPFLGSLFFLPKFRNNWLFSIYKLENIHQSEFYLIVIKVHYFNQDWSETDNIRVFLESKFKDGNCILPW